VETIGRGESPVEVTHVWKEDGVEKRFIQRVPAGMRNLPYAIEIASGARIVNTAVIFEAK